MDINIFGKSSTGTIHHYLGPQSAQCSSRTRGIRLVLITEQAFLSARESSFCRKCFPGGKPQID